MGTTAEATTVADTFLGFSRFELVLADAAVVFVDLDLLTFGPRGVYADSWQYRRYIGVDSKRLTSKSSRYNAMMRYASYSLHKRLRFPHCMHEHLTARLRSVSRVKMRGRVSLVGVTSFERSRKRRCFFVDLDLLQKNTK